MLKPDYERGNVRLWNRDCLEWLPTLEAGSVDCVWTDPPYGHGNMADDLQAARVRDKVKGARVKAAQPITNDDAESMRAVVDKTLLELTRVLRPDCCCCCCCCGGGPKPTFAWVAQRMDDAGLSFFHAVVWDKSARGNGMGWRYRRNYEFVMVAHRKSGRLLWANDAIAVPNVVRRMPVVERSHPNEKPVELANDFIRWHTTPGHTVCDPFMGSGTTAVACINLNRTFIGCEIDPRYFDLACRRIDAAFDSLALIDPTPPAVRQGALFAEDTE